MKPKTSDIWQYFVEVDDNYAKCKSCGKNYSRKGRTTTSLKGHLKSIHKEQFEELCKLEEQREQGKLQPTSSFTPLQQAYTGNDGSMLQPRVSTPVAIKEEHYGDDKNEFDDHLFDITFPGSIKEEYNDDEEFSSQLDEDSSELVQCRTCSENIPSTRKHPCPDCSKKIPSEENGHHQITTKARKQKKHSKQFKERECKLLVNICSKYQAIIEDKTSDGTRWRQKEETWKEIASDFNSINATEHGPRTAENIKNKYFNLKKELKKKKAMTRQNLDSTGGGPLTDYEELLDSILAQTTHGLESEYDPDCGPLVPSKEDNSGQLCCGDMEVVYTVNNKDSNRMQPMEPIPEEQELETAVPTQVQTAERSAEFRQSSSGKKRKRTHSDAVYSEIVNHTVERERRSEEMHRANLDLIAAQKEKTKQETFLLEIDVEKRKLEIKSVRMDMKKKRLDILARRLEIDNLKLSLEEKRLNLEKVKLEMN